MVEMAAASFADLLKRYRAAAGLTQEDLAERARLSARAISDLERGVRNRPYPHTVQRLAQALGLEEGEAVRFQHAAHRQRGAGDAPGVATEVAPQSVSLPIAPTSFIGRQQEVGEVRAMLRRAEVRLVTLTGPGGVGKTRLALRVAEQLVARFADGVVFISLAPLADPGLVPSTIAGLLQLGERSGQLILESLIEHLRGKRLLLVLDNFEHVLPAAEVVSCLLASCAQLTILVTSRAILHLAAEHEYPVPPLPIPTPMHLPEVDALSRYDAIQLFLQRSQAVRPRFEMTKENASAIAEICYRLEGLPLSIELAAARIRLFSPQALLGRLTDQLQLLTGGPRDLPIRQQTLRATIDWSYSLLSEGEQRLFARLSVFRGGGTLEAAEALCNPAGDSDLEVLEGLGALIEKSLLRREGEGAPRFLMLETIREYAKERLEGRGEAEQTRQRHATYYLKLAEAAEPELEGGQAEWFDLLGADHDNLRAAFGWFLEGGEVERQVRLAAALWRFWAARCHFSEGRRWLEAGLSQRERVALPVRMEALYAAGTLAMLQSDQASTVTLMDELLLLAREQADPVQTMHALTLLGMIGVQRGDHRQAAHYLEEYHSIARAHGSHFDVAHSLLALGAARSEAGAYAEAVSLLEEARAQFRAMANEYWEMVAVGTLAYALLLETNQQRARALLLEYLARAERFQDTGNIAASLEGLATLASEEGRAERAARLFAAAASLRQEIGSRLMSLRNRTMTDHAISSARERLGEAVWVAATEEGRAMTLQQAVALALEEDTADNGAAVRRRRGRAAVERM